MLRISHFHSAYRMADWRRDRAIQAIFDQKTMASSGRRCRGEAKKQEEEEITIMIMTMYASMVDQMLDALFIDLKDSHSFSNHANNVLKIKILKNIVKTKYFESMKTTIANLTHDTAGYPADHLKPAFEAARKKLVGDIDGVLKRPKRVHLTHRAMRVFDAKKMKR